MHKILKKIPTFEYLKQDYPNLRALFFDMDGTLFNTEPHHTKAFVKIGQDYNISPPHSLEEIHELLVGKADYLVYEIVKNWPGFPVHLSCEKFVELKNKNLFKILGHNEEKHFFHPLMHELLNEAKHQNIFLALVTSSEKVITQKLLELANIKDHFDLLITRDDCPRHKPDPWPYLNALKLSGMSPHEVIIFEDSAVGLTSANGSGAHVIKVEWH